MSCQRRPLNAAMAGYALLTTLALALISRAAAAEEVTWTGTGGTSWAAPASWSNALGPAATDHARFDWSANATAAGVTTSALDAHRTVAGLTFEDYAGSHHTLDLNGSGLTVKGPLSFDLFVHPDGLIGPPATVTMRNGPLTVQTAGDVRVGEAFRVTSTAAVDLSGLSAFTASVREVRVGTVVDEPGGGGFATGAASAALTLPARSTITATARVVVGANLSPTWRYATGTLRLGASTNVLAPEFTIGQTNAAATVDMPAGGSLTIGSDAQPTLLQVGVGNYVKLPGVNDPYFSKLELNGSSLSARLSSLKVGDVVASRAATAALTGAAAGSLTVGGGAGGASGIFAVGRNLGSPVPTTAAADLSAIESLAANVTSMVVGVHSANTVGGAGSGTLHLPANSTIRSPTLTVGSGAGGGTGVGTVTLGRTANTLLVDLISAGRNFGNGTITTVPGASVAFGAPDRRAAVRVAAGTNDNAGHLPTRSETFTGRIDLTGSPFTGHLADLVVAQRDGSNASSPESYSGTFVAGAGGGGGTISVGAPGTNTANIYVGRVASGTQVNNTYGSATGTLDLAGLDSMTARLNAFEIGTTARGPAAGAVTLPRAVDIDALRIVVGSGAAAANTAAPSRLTLGVDNTILADEVVVAQGYARAVIDTPSGAHVSLGSSARPANLYVGTGVATIPFASNATWAGTLDLSAASLSAHLNAVSIGHKPGHRLPSGEPALAGTLTIGDAQTNYVVARSVFVGGPESSGVLNFGGGQFVTDAFNAYPFAGTFNWAGGRLSANVINRDVAVAYSNHKPEFRNSGGGTLAPGAATSPVATTEIWGAYTQGPAAATEVDIRGTVAGTGYDQLRVFGHATLDGALSVAVAETFQPVPLASFRVFTFASRTGRFATYTGLDVPGPLTLAPVYSATDLRLVATLPGDATLDGHVDFDDLLKLAQNYNTAAPDAVASSWQVGDFTHDRTIDFDDLLLLAQNYNASAVATSVPGASPEFNADLAAAFASVPEPAATAVLALGTLSLLTRRRTRP